jgi:hypothetical protein
VTDVGCWGASIYLISGSVFDDSDSHYFIKVVVHFDDTHFYVWVYFS